MSVCARGVGGGGGMVLAESERRMWSSSGPIHQCITWHMWLIVWVLMDQGVAMSISCHHSPRKNMRTKKRWRKKKGEASGGSANLPKKEISQEAALPSPSTEKKVRIRKRTEGARGGSHSVNLVIWTAQVTVTLFFLALLFCLLFFVSWECFCVFSSVRKRVTESLLESRNHF